MSLLPEVGVLLHFFIWVGCVGSKSKSDSDDKPQDYLAARQSSQTAVY